MLALLALLLALLLTHALLLLAPLTDRRRRRRCWRGCGSGSRRRLPHDTLQVVRVQRRPCSTGKGNAVKWMAAVNHLTLIAEQWTFRDPDLGPVFKALLFFGLFMRRSSGK